MMFKIIEVLGMIAFALSGVIEARRRNMDLMGVFAISLITSFGGGTLRDILLDRRPLYWIENQELTILVLVVSFVASVTLSSKRFHATEKTILFPDALGLGLYSASGVAIALRSGTTPFIAVIIGIISASFGSVLRDIACNEIPIIFRRGQLYATCSFFASLAFVLMRHFHIHDTYSIFVCIIITAVMRFLAVKYDVKLPL